MSNVLVVLVSSCEWPQIYRRGSVVFGYCRLFCFLFCFAHIYETGIQMPSCGILFLSSIVSSWP